MEELRVGTIVTRHSYGNDIFFRIAEIWPGEEEPEARLLGLDMRLEADAPVSDLDTPPLLEIFRYKQRVLLQNYKRVARLVDRRQVSTLPLDDDPKRDQQRKLAYQMPGSVLHIDGNEEYLELCLDTYKQLNIRARGFCYPEGHFPDVVSRHLERYKPDILIITGHDSLLKEAKDSGASESYRNSHHFVEAVHAARKVVEDPDELVIFAGGCQSNFEALLKAGANYASSPDRVMIHALDPVLIAEKLAYTPVHEYVELQDVLANTISGPEGIGGIRTRGCFRWGNARRIY
ncbi:sporulation peptidase YabG [Heliobacterium undosum]|uniref:Sporulation peptidase YabG n=1 Tax=Heliomicrobium undosum TaxID=121734 RepID=A0A845L2N8_9FIRM|nr:sporulation peptidase YabG [Heliomicrobium undosum]MZP29275.1 sporulation peptidase YabG [Heliomicrobium undosum]